MRHRISVTATKISSNDIFSRNAKDHHNKRSNGKIYHFAFIFILFFLLVNSLLLYTNTEPRKSLLNITLPSCKTKGKKNQWKEIYNASNTSFSRPESDTLLLPPPPFTSGDPPICSLESSTSSPIPVILIAKGRSGTSSTWQVLSRLTGHCFECQEYTGSDTASSFDFFSRVGENDNGNWIKGYLCNQQTAFKDKGGIIGFKWKPFSYGKIHNDSQVKFSDSMLDGLRMIAHHRSPKIRVIRLTRNLLDVRLSQKKHWFMTKFLNETAEGKRQAHCAPNNTECIKKHEKFSTGLRGEGLHIPTKNLIYKLGRMLALEDVFDRHLNELQVPHIHVSYEKLFYGDDAEEWMRIFRFLGRGPGSDLSRDLVHEAMEHVGTSSNSLHKDSMENYEEVRNILMGSKFEYLLH